MFKRILVPVDGSGTSERGLAEAIKIAKSQRATVHLLHVVDERVLLQSIGGGVIEIDRLLASLRDSGHQILAAAQAKARKSQVHSTAILAENVVNSVAGVIVGQAKKLRADVIVLGTHGRRGIRRIVMGSDAEEVVRTTPVPVLLVRSREG